MNGTGAGVQEVIRLLVASSEENRHPAVRRAANALLEWMAEHSWRITRGAHAGGRGDDRGPDETMHITLVVYGVRGHNRACHLRMDKRGHLFQITDRPGRILPHETPPWTGL